MSLDFFLRDLDRVAVTITPPLRTHDFLRDLDQVASAAMLRVPNQLKLNTGDLIKLSERFDEVRNVALAKLGGKNWLQLVEEHDPLRCPVGLFTTLDLGRHETAHTSALTWLLSPTEDHGFKDELLRPLVRQLFELEVDPVLFDVHTANEYPTRGERGRLDIHITGGWKLPEFAERDRFRIIIEAKIDANEGEDQCERYEDHALITEQEKEQVRLVFLTHDGRKAASTKGGPDKWMHLSFIELMAIFRARLGLIRQKPGFEFLRHYMSGVLQELYKIECGRPELSNHLYSISTYLGQFTPQEPNNV